MDSDELKRRDRSLLLKKKREGYEDNKLVDLFRYNPYVRENEFEGELGFLQPGEYVVDGKLEKLLSLRDVGEFSRVRDIFRKKYGIKDSLFRKAWVDRSLWSRLCRKVVGRESLDRRRIFSSIQGGNGSRINCFSCLGQNVQLGNIKV